MMDKMIFEEAKTIAKDNLDYHNRQIITPYRSTVKMTEWLNEKGVFKDNTKILDMACGGGANLIYLAEKFPNVNFEGIDYDDKVVELARSNVPIYLQNINEIIQGNWFDLNEALKNRYSGCISFQTLSWLDDYKEAIAALDALNLEWMAFSSLFWEGNVDYFIKAVDYGNEIVNFNDCNGIYNYNVYSLPSVKNYFVNLGYKEFDYIPFVIDIDLEQKTPHWFGTYTKKLDNGERIQISGGIMMPWYFIFARK